MRLRLVGTPMTAAPLHEVAARRTGTSQSVDGEVGLEPVETGVCRATGRSVLGSPVSGLRKGGRGRR